MGDLARPSESLLLVGPDPSFARLIGRLDEMGVPSAIAGTVDAAIDRALGSEWTAVVVDSARSIDVESLRRRLSGDPTLDGVPIVVLVAREDMPDALGVLDAGADDLLGKPVDPDELLSRVRVAVRLRARRRRSDRDDRDAILGLAATVGHEVSNPLTALFGHLELARQYLDREDPGRARHHLREAGEVAHRIGRVAHRLTFLEETPKPQPVDAAPAEAQEGESA